MNAYQRFPKKWKTLGVRWPNRHGVTATIRYECRCLRYMSGPYKVAGDRLDLACHMMLMQLWAFNMQGGILAGGLSVLVHRS